jgi:hypothetical protein
LLESILKPEQNLWKAVYKAPQTTTWDGRWGLKLITGSLELGIWRASGLEGKWKKDAAMKDEATIVPVQMSSADEGPT